MWLFITLFGGLITSSTGSHLTLCTHQQVDSQIPLHDKVNLILVIDIVSVPSCRRVISAVSLQANSPLWEMTGCVLLFPSVHRILMWQAAVFEQQVVMTLTSALFNIKLNLFKGHIMHECQEGYTGVRVSQGGGTLWITHFIWKLEIMMVLVRNLYQRICV